MSWRALTSVALLACCGSEGVGPLDVEPIDIEQGAYLKASNTDEEDRFGSAIAFDGDTLVIGAFGEGSNASGVGGSQTDNSAKASGAVYVFRRSGSVWAQEAYLKASNNSEDALFGASVALDGDTLVVGAIGESSGSTGVDGDQATTGANRSGAVYVFQRSGSTWAQEAYLKASNTDANDSFGSAVAIDGDTLAVGATGEESAATGIDGDQTDNSIFKGGAVYVFLRSESGWSQEAYVKPSNTEELDQFGWSVALSGDTLAVGAPRESSSATGIDGDQQNNGADASGAVYVYRRAGTTWQQEAYVKASNTDWADAFGWALALEEDTLVVGARLESSSATGIDGDQANNSTIESGAAYIFRRTGTSWEQEAYVKASNPGVHDHFGSSIALSGETLAIGAIGESSNATNASVDQDDDSAERSGAVYLFRRADSTWTHRAYVKARVTDEFDIFGTQVALQGDTLAVGAPREESNATGVNGDELDNSLFASGAVYVFD